MSAAAAPVQATFPAKLSFFFDPHRYKVAYGGRGSAKSWSAARALVIIGVQRPIRWLCAREIQRSISESVYRLLVDQIEMLGLGPAYRVLQTSIEATNGTTFSFAGLRHNATSLKSYEGYDGVWVEEAQAVSDESWAILIPTIRRDGSEIWMTFNPDLEEDPTYQRFVVHPPPGARIQLVNWQDNPYFPMELRKEMEHLRATNYNEYLHVYEGHCRPAVVGAVYAREIEQAKLDGRIRKVPYDRSLPVHVAWDLGWGDTTALWFVQVAGWEYRLIDCAEANHTAIADWLRLLQSRGYVYGTMFLPHDARAGQLGTGKSIEEMIRGSGYRTTILPRLAVADGISAARAVFPTCWFDADKCADGLHALRHYHYPEAASTGRTAREPMHDWSSHFADSFRYFAMGAKPAIVTPRPAPRREYEAPMTDRGWMV